MELLHQTSFGIGVLGVLVICFGVASGLYRFVRSEWLAIRGVNVTEDRQQLRHALGYYLLLGLEFLIAADIMNTLMKLDVQGLVVLGAIIVIRTVISWSLNAELRTGSAGVSPASSMTAENSTRRRDASASREAV